jgi:L-methionine (R)-S-oxide reductase
MDESKVSADLARLAAAPDPTVQAKAMAEMIRSTRGYRWVGLYEVTETEIGAVAWTGAEAPAFPRFPVSHGLCGAAVKSRQPVIVGNVKSDPRYLTTFGSTQSEMIVPVLDANAVVGLIDVESERHNAFSERDTRFLERCAAALLPLFRRTAKQNL